MRLLGFSVLLALMVGCTNAASVPQATSSATTGSGPYPASLTVAGPTAEAVFSFPNQGHAYGASLVGCNGSGNVSLYVNQTSTLPNPVTFVVAATGVGSGTCSVALTVDGAPGRSIPLSYTVDDHATLQAELAAVQPQVVQLLGSLVSSNARVPQSVTLPFVRVYDPQLEKIGNAWRTDDFRVGIQRPMLLVGIGFAGGTNFTWSTQPFSPGPAGNDNCSDQAAFSVIRPRVYAFDGSDGSIVVPIRAGSLSVTLMPFSIVSQTAKFGACSLFLFTMMFSGGATGVDSGYSAIHSGGQPS